MAHLAVRSEWACHAVMASRRTVLVILSATPIRPLLVTGLNRPLYVDDQSWNVQGTRKTTNKSHSTNYKESCAFN